jgi:Glycosyl transferases group 1
MKMTVLYAGLRSPHAGWAAIDELALILARVFQAELLSPAIQPGGLLRRLTGREKLQFAPLACAGGDVLFVVARGPEDLAMVNAIRNVRTQFSRIHAFVTDSYFQAGFYAETALFDSITVTAHEDRAFPAQQFGIPVHQLYQGTDALQWAPRQAFAREIDVMSFGRTPPSYQQALTQAFHRMDSPHLYLHSPLGNLSGPTVPVERAMLFKLLHRTRISLAFHLLIEPQGGRPRSMMVTSRWLESLLSGCVVAGRRPVSRMADEMLDWPGSTIELSASPEEAVHALQELLQDEAALQQQRRLNVHHTVQRHDWRQRIHTLCGLNGWAVPPALQDELQQLEALAQQWRD